MRFTILGANGFIGRQLVHFLRAKGDEVLTPSRAIDFSGHNLGHVIHAAGVVGGARNRTLEMVEAHVNLTQKLLTLAQYESFLYLSTTRLYAHSASTQETALISLPANAHSAFDFSKLLGESLCWAIDRPDVRIARLANVYGPGMNTATFLGSILSDLKKTGTVEIGEDPQSAKDYVHVDDVVSLLIDIVLKGQQRIYNVASGISVTHAEIAKALKSIGHITFKPEGSCRAFPMVDITRLSTEFTPPPSRVTEDLSRLLTE